MTSRAACTSTRIHFERYWHMHSNLDAQLRTHAHAWHRLTRKSSTTHMDKELRAKIRSRHSVEIWTAQPECAGCARNGTTEIGGSICQYTAWHRWLLGLKVSVYWSPWAVLATPTTCCKLSRCKTGYRAPRCRVTGPQLATTLYRLDSLNRLKGL